MSDLYYLKNVKYNSKYYTIVLDLWKNYMPSINTTLDYLGFERLMGQFPQEVDNPEDIWYDLIEKGNLVKK